MEDVASVEDVVIGPVNLRMARMKEVSASWRGIILQKAHDLYIINGFDNAGISKALDGEDDDDIPVPEVTSSAIDTSDEEPHNDFVDYIVL